MVNDRPYVQYVLDSSVRSDTLRAVVDGAGSTEAVLDGVEASDSAVYNAVTSLRQRGLIAEREEGWTATGSGRLVADIIAQQRRVDDLLARTDYWERHDLSVVPERFRRRLDALAGAERIAATDTTPYRVVKEVARRIEESEAPRVIAPVYVEEYGDSMPDREEARLLIDTDLFAQLVSDGQTDDGFGHTAVRVADVDFALAVTDESLLLSLPTLDGQYDARTEIVATDERALRWGQRLFDHYWSAGTDPETFASRRLG